MMVSKYFSYREVTRSNQARRLGIENNPNARQLENIKDLLINVADPVREFIGGPLKAESIFRSRAVSLAMKKVYPPGRVSVGGQHEANKGAAIDLDDDYMFSPTMHKLAINPDYKNMRNRDIFYFIINNLEWDQIIWELGDGDSPGWVHVSYRKGHNRKKITISYMDGRSMKYVHSYTREDFENKLIEIYGEDAA